MTASIPEALSGGKSSNAFLKKIGDGFRMRDMRLETSNEVKQDVFAKAGTAVTAGYRYMWCAG